MKAVIFAGGLGTRIAEESINKPKPMVEIGGRPLLWHIMHIYSLHGVREFVVCLGHKGYVAKEYFANYHRHTTDITVDLAAGSLQTHARRAEDWKITLADTGGETQTGGRLKRVESYLDGEPFCLTYGDGLANVDVTAELAFHRQTGKLATVTAVQPPGRFGRLDLREDVAVGFEEKPRGEFGWVNGGFFVFEPEVLNRLHADSGPIEHDLLPELANESQLSAFRHNGFWMSCDTMRDKLELERIWSAGDAPWLSVET